ncbi:MAG TPA: ABC transporter ATP-binding protein [Syntrophomonadaceae bacterium]|nr:ABC transporter ATP-binding protein [Syntrophomonadaceae bacterium]
MGGFKIISYAAEICNLRKVYRVGEEKVVALDNVSFALEKGETTCILGVSGSGKSTLLNMMAGLEKPTKGIIKIYGKNIEKMDERLLARFRQFNVGFVFQSYNLLPALTALENVSLPLTFRGIARKKRDKMAMDMLEAVGLKNHLKHKPSQMSGGQQQRVGIARAFVSRAKIVFADEPTGNLDSATTNEVMELITKISKENRQNLVIVTHDIGVAKYADRIIHLFDGNIEKIENNTEKGVG